MEDAKQNPRRVPQIELPPSLAPKPHGGAPKKPDSGDQAGKDERQPPALRSTDTKRPVVESTPHKTNEERLILEAGGDTKPVDTHSPLTSQPPSASRRNALFGMCLALFVAVVIIVVASQKPASDTANLVQQPPVATTPVPSPAASSVPGTSNEVRALPPAEPTASRESVVESPTPPPLPTVNKVASQRPSLALATRKVEIRKPYIWRDRTYYVPANQLQTFHALRKAGLAKMAAIDKRTGQIANIELQMETADRKTRARLANQRDLLSAQQTKATSEYSDLVSQMDQLTSSLANP
jgi:hypothetical protein